MKTFKQYFEDFGFATTNVAANAVSAGNVAGIGYGPDGEPGGKKHIMSKRILRRRKPNVDSKVSS